MGGRTGDRITVLIIVIVAVTGISNVYISSRGGSLDDEKDASEGGRLRLEYYCNDPSSKDATPRLPATLGQSPAVGAEGVAPPGWELTKMVLAIRHGDRSHIHEIPKTVVTHTPAEQQPSYFMPEAVQLAEQLKQGFQLDILGEGSDGEKGISRMAGLEGVLEREPVFAPKEEELPPGLLTTTGFMQHHVLGKHLHVTYSDFLRKHIQAADDIYVRSTNYQRTVLSVTGLLLGFQPLPPKTAAAAQPKTEAVPQPKLEAVRRSAEAAAEKLAIHVLADETAEIMHGVGESFSSHVVDPIKGEKVNPGSCGQSTVKARAQMGEFETGAAVLKEVWDAYGPGSISIPKRITELTDAVLPAHCHRTPFPHANTTGPGEGGNKGGGGERGEKERVLGSMMAEADRFYCERYTGNMGGKEATLLSIHPFLLEILEHLKGDGGGGDDGVPRVRGSGEGAKRAKLSVFSGHDTVIAPVLAGLGVYSSPEAGLCHWPRYASRIQFEVWTKGEEKGVKIHYNGMDVTSLVPSCKFVQAGEPCPFSLFAAQVSSMLGGAPSFAAACQTA